MQGQQEEMETKMEQQTHHLVAAKAQLATLHAYSKRLHQRLANATSARGPVDINMQRADSASFLKTFPLHSEQSRSLSSDFGASLAASSRQRTASQGLTASQGPAESLDAPAPPFPTAERTELLVEAPVTARSGQGEVPGVGIYASYVAPERTLASMSYSVGITYKNLLDAANAAPSGTARMSSTGGEAQDVSVRKQEDLLVQTPSPQ